MAKTKQASGSKNFVLAMVLVCLAEAVGGWYLYSEAESSVSTLRDSQADVIAKAVKIKNYYRPSLELYYSMIENNQILEPPKREVKERTKELMDDICKNMLRLNDDQYQTNITPPKSLSSSSKEKVEQRIVTCDLEGVNRRTYEAALQMAREKFNIFATITDIRIDPYSKGRSSIPSYSEGVSESSLLWKVSFKIIWYDEVK